MTGLRRTAIQRKTELRRTPMPRRKTALVSRAKSTMARQARYTGPTPAVRDMVAARAGWACELCGTPLMGWDGYSRAYRTHSFHHRRPRGNGGSSWSGINLPSNLLLLCGTGVTGCHGAIEKNRDIARDNGWLVRFSKDPAEVEVIVFLHGEDPVRLTDGGDYLEVAA